MGGTEWDLQYHREQVLFHYTTKKLVVRLNNTTSQRPHVTSLGLKKVKRFADRKLPTGELKFAV